TVQTGVTNNRGILGLEWRTFWREDRDTTTGHAFTDIVIGIAFQTDMQATSIPDTQRLARSTIQVNFHRMGFHAQVAITFSNFTRQACANRTVTVTDREAIFAASSCFDGR